MSEMAKRKRIGIIFGGRSGEHEVSLLSAASVIRAMNKEKYELVYIGITRQGRWMKCKGTVEDIESGAWEETAEPFNMMELKEHIDFALPIMHGPYCEDGKIQGLLEMADIPYGGCGVLASAVAMDKAVAKDLFTQHGLPVCKYIFATREDIEKEADKVCIRVSKEIGFPCFVKPANMGSSVGISKAVDIPSLKEALDLANRYDKRIVIEEGINCRELETGVVGNSYPEAAAVGEIVSGSDFYDYTAKYSDGGSALCIPAPVADSVQEKIRQLALKAYKAIDGEGYARVDFFLDRDSGRVFINEINTIPGFTKYSMFPQLWEKAGVPYEELLERIIDLGYERYNDKNSR